MKNMNKNELMMLNGGAVALKLRVIGDDGTGGLKRPVPTPRIPLPTEPRKPLPDEKA